MPWNGSGQFNRTNGVFTGATVWDDSRVAGRTVRSDDHDTHDEDIATGLENTVTLDGQNQPTTNLPMGGFRHTNVDDAEARTDYASAAQIQDQGLTHIVAASVGGTGDAITLSPTPAITAYAAGQKWSFLAEATNTGAVTVNVSSLGTQAVQKLGAALVAGDITTGDLVAIEYDGTQFQLLTPARTPVLASDLVINIQDITDSNGNEVMSFVGVASAVNELTATNAATGNNPDLSPTGDDTNIGISYSTKGTGQHAFTGAINEDQGADIASATTTDIGAATGNYVDVTGTTTITGLGTVQAGTRRIVQFDSALTLTHNGTSLILPTEANITTVAGDIAEFVSLGSGNWKCTSYQRQDGSALVASNLTLEPEQATTSGTTVDFTGISSDAKRITVMLNGVSTSGSDELFLQLGDSGGFESGGYFGSVRQVVGGSITWAVSTVATLTTGLAAGDTATGSISIDLMNTSNTWIFHGQLVDSADAGNPWLVQGRKATSATLDRIRLGTSGSDTFDAGAINISIET